MERQTFSQTTKDDYRRDLLRFQKTIKGDEPTFEEVQGYLDWMKQQGKSGSHISRTAHAIKGYCQYFGFDYFAQGHEKAQGKIQIPELQFGEIDPETVITEDEVMTLIQNARSPMESALISLLFDTGCRITEVLNLTVDDVNWQTGIISVIRKGKRKRKQKTSVYPETLRYLKQYRDERGLKKGQKLFDQGYHRLRAWLIDLASKCGITFPRGSVFHNLRHARGTTDREAGIPIADISDTLGHASVDTTAKVYTRLEPRKMLQHRKAPPWVQKGNSGGK